MRDGPAVAGWLLALLVAVALPVVLGDEDQGGATTPAVNAGATTRVVARGDGLTPVVEVLVRDVGGFWLVGEDGGVFSYEGAPFHGSAGAMAVEAHFTAAVATPGGGGYWLIGEDGGVFAFGDAGFHGSLGSVELVAPVVSAARTPSGRGYWLFAADGGVFAFGDAGFHGSLGAMSLDEPIVDATVTPSGGGYLLLGRDGGVFAFGDAVFPGSAVTAVGGLAAIAIEGATSPTVTTTDGSVWSFDGNAARRAVRMELPPDHRVVTADGGIVVSERHLRRVTIAMTGDLLPHGGVQRAAWTSHGYDFAPMLAPIAPMLRAADLALCHLEVVISGTDRDLASYPRFRAPRALAAGIASAGYDGCSTASNHALDHGVGGVATTLEALDAAGVGHSGTARSEAERSTSGRYTVDDVDVAHLSYTFSVNGALMPADQPWSINVIDTESMAGDAARARADGADIVVVSVHWGSEYRVTPNDHQRAVAAELASLADIDVVVGHHAHVVQPVERIGDTHVLYGLGNSLSGMVRFGTKDGVIVTLEFTESLGGGFELAEVMATPTWNERPHAVVVAGRDGRFASSARRTLDTLGSWGVDVTPAFEPDDIGD